MNKKFPINTLIASAITLYQLVVGIIELNKIPSDDYSKGSAVEVTVFGGFRAAVFEHGFLGVKLWTDYYYLILDESGVCQMLIRADSSLGNKFDSEGIASSITTVKGIVKTVPKQISDIIRQQNYSSYYGVSETLYINLLYKRVAWCRIGVFASFFTAAGLIFLRYHLLVSEKIIVRGTVATILSVAIFMFINLAAGLMIYVMLV